MAHKKGGGTTRNGRDSESKRLGVKVYGGQAINAGGIIIVSAAPSFMQARTSAWVKTTLCLHSWTAKFSLQSKVRKSVTRSWSSRPDRREHPAKRLCRR